MLHSLVQGQFRLGLPHRSQCGEWCQRTSAPLEPLAQMVSCVEPVPLGSQRGLELTGRWLMDVTPLQVDEVPGQQTPFKTTAHDEHGLLAEMSEPPLMELRTKVT